LKKCQDEKQRIVSQVAKGTFDEDMIKPTMCHIKEREEHWLQELTNAETFQVNANTIWNEFKERLHAINRMYDYGFTLSFEQKKDILNTLLHEFVLEPDGKIELRFKLPVTDKQLTVAVETMLAGDTS
jgi:hypothetical protein